MDVSHEQLLPYDPKWKEEYEKEKNKLENVFGEEIIDIQHIGSTAIPNLSAKPIVDIGVLLKTDTVAESFIEPLKEIGYVFNVEGHTKFGSPERHFLRKGNPTKFHLSLGYADRGSFWKRQILFRDYLRTHQKEREEYQKIKEQGLRVDPSGADE
mgnify:FL=1